MMTASDPPTRQTTERAIERDAELLRVATASTTRRERRQQRRMAALVQDPDLRALTFVLTDEVLRFADDRRAASRFRSIVADLGAPPALGFVDRALLRTGAVLSSYVPRVVMPLVRARIFRESAGAVVPADDPAFAAHVAKRVGVGFGLNVNVLGEAILSDAEADGRIRQLLDFIDRPDVNYVSLKISAVVANLDVLAFEHSVSAICDRLRVLYRAGQRSQPVTFVSLDMEEFRDLPLTLAALKRVLDEPEFATIDAGVVLQAYIPDAHDACQRLCEWAQARHERAGGSLKIRIVKGANLAMERVDAELHGWPQAPYETKAEVDASFKRLVEHPLDLRWSGAVRVGFASHNLFDVAWALGLPGRQRIEFEMLEGMAPAQARAVRDEVGHVLLYTPVVRRDDLAASIAYLARRLDENTAPENFLRSVFALTPGSREWDAQRARFESAIDGRRSVSTSSRRRQDRSIVVEAQPLGTFENCPDTDWTRDVNRAWIDNHLDQPGTPEIPVTHTIAEIDAVVSTARAAAASWASTTFDERRTVLSQVATEMEASRGNTLALMARTACKTISEGDPEVSEAVDFARYYGWCTHAIEERQHSGLSFAPIGVVLVASPWNFPYAIPASGVLAALAAGNAVLLKPAPEVRQVAHEMASQLWRSGVPRDVLQFVACPDDQVGRHLVTHAGVDLVVLTGALETAQLFRSWKPSIRLIGETSGKNALVITAAADVDAAIKDLVRSAFGHAGQKCSAASLAIIEASLYDDPNFQRRLADAVRSIRLGPADDVATMMGPLIGEPPPKLLRALTHLEPGEHWLVEPRCLDPDRHLWSPGVRGGVTMGSWFHMTECFGPVLGVMRADNLDHAIELQNAVAFGLTGGIHSLDEREIDSWLDRVEVGNAYVNRHITGAIVRRQPFGGWKRSSVGCGPKAGGPAYVEGFGTWTGGSDDETLFRVVWQEYFTAEHDPSGLACESNLLRYRPLSSVGLYVSPGAAPTDVAVAEMAARVAGVPLVRLETPASTTADRVRVVGSLTDDQLAECHVAGIEVDRVQPVADATVELRRWVREQSVSWTRHRHGRPLRSSGR